MSQKITSKRRWYVLLVLLLAAFYLAFWADKTPNQPQEKRFFSAAKKTDIQSRSNPRISTESEQIKTQSPSLSSAQEKSPVFAALVSRSQLIPSSEGGLQVKRDLFSSNNWNPQLPLISAVTPLPDIPTAPPLPFTYIGKKLEQGVWEVFLTLADKTLVARAGSSIENLYRVDEIIPPLLTVTYLPLGISQSLSIGDSQ